MRQGTIVGAVALTMGMTSLAFADSLETPKQQERFVNHVGPVIQESHIARLHAVLNLKPEQQKYWTPVEAALRSLARQQAREAAGVGLVQRMGDKATTLAGTAVKLRRLASAAAPLIRALDESQKSSAMSFVHSAGFGHLATAF